MPELSRVLLVGPFPGRRWLSIARYCEAIVARSGVEGVTISRASAPWWNPPSVAQGLVKRWWRDPVMSADRAFPADVVHFADQGLGHHIGRFERRPTVVTCHDLMPFRLESFYRREPERVVKQTFLRRSIDAMRRATRIIAVSQWTAEEVSDMLQIDPRRISVVPNMVADVYQPYPGAREWLMGQDVVLPDGPLILSVGHVGEYKNVSMTIAALADPALRGAWLVRAGVKLAPHHRQLAAKLGVADRIVELGGLPSAKLARLYAACDVLAQPSLGEGFGVPVVEAMAARLPVVASNGGALPEVVGDAGVIVPLPANGGSSDPRAVASYATALAEVIEDEAFADDLRTRGEARAAEFRPAEVTPKLFAAYRRAISGF